MKSAYRTELRTQLHVALPIFGGQLAQSANGFVDTVMSGRVSALDLAAVAVGASIWVPVFLFMTGLLVSATSVLSRNLGAGNHHRVTPLMHQVLLLCLAIGALSFVLLRSTEPVLRLMDVDPAMQPMVRDYLKGLSWGMPAIAVVLGLRSYSESMSHTRPVLWISVIGLLANIPLNYVLIYGKLGLPALGGVGCGWATAGVMWLMALLMVAYVRFDKAYAGNRLRFWPLHVEPQNLFYLLRLGLPVGMVIFFEVSIFSVIALLISQLGAEVVAGHQLSLNFTSLVFMLPLSFALAATARIAHARGREDEAGLKLSVQVAFGIAATIGISAALLLVLLRNWIPHIYTDNPRVIELASYLLWFAALYQISDALQVTANGCLRGFEDTKVPMVMGLVAYWGVGFPLGYSLAMSDFWGRAMGPAGFWIGLVAGLTTAAVLLGLRLRWRVRQDHFAKHHTGT